MMAIITQTNHLGDSDVIVIYDDVAMEMVKIGAVNRSKTQKIRIKIRSPITLERVVTEESIFDDNLPSKLKYIPVERELEGGKKIIDYKGILWHAVMGN